MLLAVGPLAPWTDFLQIICWIVLPVLILTIACTSAFHYFRKKNNAEKALADDEILNLTSFNNKEKPAYFYFDHSGVLNKYKDKLTYSHARYAALRKDFEQLEKKYRRTQRSLSKNSSSNKTDVMENTIGQPTEITATVSNESTVTEVKYLKDLVEEKNAQVAFLQSQLDQRIRKQHEVEFNLEEKEKELQGKIQAISNKEEQLAYSEGLLVELRAQNELLNASVADSQEKMENVEKQLEDEKLKFKSIEEKLHANKQLMQRLYREFSACMENEVEEPVVVNMRPAFYSTAAE